VSTAAIWGVCTWVGATLGAQLPEWLDLTFIVPVVFLAILAPMLRTRRDLVVGGVAAGVALACHALPFGLGLMVGASVGIALGLVLERRAP
ncbi:MAG: branched-chain amino acid ABC transporter permease, partial [Pseudomonadota bacterium]